MAETAHTAYLHTPIGWLEITGSLTGITAITFLDENPTVLSPEIPACLQNCHSQLSEYFQGTRTAFNLNLQPNGTEFQQKVWQQLTKIGFGGTRSYLDVALQLGQPTYTRAVGSANSKNPLAIIVPCHRVIGANGSLTGYAGGLWRKKWLLQFESRSRQTDIFPEFHLFQNGS